MNSGSFLSISGYAWRVFSTAADSNQLPHQVTLLHFKSLGVHLKEGSVDYENVRRVLVAAWVTTRIVPPARPARGQLQVVQALQLNCPSESTGRDWGKNLTPTKFNFDQRES